MVLHVWLMLFSDTDQQHCHRRSVGFLNLPTRRSFKLAKRTAIVCAQAPVSQAVLCRWAQCFTESWWLCWLQQNGELHSRITTIPWLLGKWPSDPSERQLSPLVCKWTFGYRNWIWYSKKWSVHRFRWSLGKHWHSQVLEILAGSRMVWSLWGPLLPHFPQDGVWAGYAIVV